MAGQVLFDRRCRLTVEVPVSTPNDFKSVTSQRTVIDAGTTDDRAKSGLRVRFHVTKSLKKEPNAGTITVFNLSPEHRKEMQQKGVRVTLEAGYKGNVFRVFSGDARSVTSDHNGTDWETEFKLGDGERSYRFAKVYESFAEGTSKADVLKKLVTSMGIDTGNLDQASQSVQGAFSQGYTAAGLASKAVDRLVKGLHKTWSVQDGRFQLLGKDEATKSEVVLINRSSGMVGYPEVGTPAKKGEKAIATVKSLLIPMTPGSRIKVESDRLNGVLRVESCDLDGDTHGGEWYTVMRAKVS